jgi:hypothetical protein
MKPLIATALLFAALGAGASGPPTSVWQLVPTPAPFGISKVIEVGGGGPNPIVDIDAKDLRGSWLRVSAQVHEASDDMRLFMFAWSSATHT